MPPDQAPATIEVKVDKVVQLFDTLDPFPFRERDLNRDAEEFIVGWARELPARRAIRIVVHLPAGEAETEHARELGGALNRYFRYREEAVTNDLKELFRIGRFSLATGLSVLAVCIAVGGTLSTTYRGSEIVRFFNEGLIILGWVANWRPIEIFLYEWWPLVRRRNLYRRLAAATVALAPR